MCRVDLCSDRYIYIIILLNTGLNWISLLREYISLLDMKNDTPPPGKSNNWKRMIKIIQQKLKFI